MLFIQTLTLRLNDCKSVFYENKSHLMLGANANVDPNARNTPLTGTASPPSHGDMTSSKKYIKCVSAKYTEHSNAS